MVEQTIKKQVAREYYNVLFGAKLNLASLDICEKLPTLISFASLSFGVLGLAFAEFNNKVLASLLLIIGIIGLILKPREYQKEEYKDLGNRLTVISKQLESIYCHVNEQDSGSVKSAQQELEKIQKEHASIKMISPVFLSSWYAHYKIFSEHSCDWMCQELNLSWRDKIPLSLRVSLISLFIFALIWVNPFCFATKSWKWVSEPCLGCWHQNSVEKESLPAVVSLNDSGNE